MQNTAGNDFCLLWQESGTLQATDAAGQSDLDAAVMQMGVVCKKKPVHQMDQNHSCWGDGLMYYKSTSGHVGRMSAAPSR